MTVAQTFLSNDQEFPPILLVSDWLRGHLLRVSQSEYTANGIKSSGVFGVSIFSR